MYSNNALLPLLCPACSLDSNKQRQMDDDLNAPFNSHQQSECKKTKHEVNPDK